VPAPLDDRRTGDEVYTEKERRELFSGFLL
jgi:hypothetical protein